MTHPAVLPLLCILLALTACSGNAPRRPQDAILATPGMQVQASATSAELMGGNQPAATPEPTALPTIDPIIIQLAADVKAANERAQEALNQINAQNERIAKSNENAAIANAQTAKYNDAQRAKDVDIANAITTQKIAEAANNEALAEIEKAQARTKEANAQLVNSLCIMAVTVSLVLLAVHAMRRYQVVMLPAPEAVEHSPDVYRPVVQTAPTSLSMRPLPVEPEIFAAFIQYAIQEKPLGVNKICDEAKIIKRESHRLIMPYLQDLGYVGYKNSASVLTDEGISFGKWWLNKYAPHPAPDASMPESAAYPRHDHENHAMDDGGGDVVDDENGENEQ